MDKSTNEITKISDGDNMGLEGQKIADGKMASKYIMFEVKLSPSGSNDRGEDIADGVFSINYETQHIWNNHFDLHSGKSKTSAYSQHTKMKNENSMQYSQNYMLYKSLKKLWNNNFVSFQRRKGISESKYIDMKITDFRL